MMATTRTNPSPHSSNEEDKKTSGVAAERVSAAGALPGMPTRVVENRENDLHANGPSGYTH
jgi:hypothetical protein